MLDLIIQFIWSYLFKIYTAIHKIQEHIFIYFISRITSESRRNLLSSMFV